MNATTFEIVRFYGLVVLVMIVGGAGGAFLAKRTGYTGIARAALILSGACIG